MVKSFFLFILNQNLYLFLFGNFLRNSRDGYSLLGKKFNINFKSLLPFLYFRPLILNSPFKLYYLEQRYELSPFRFHKFKCYYLPLWHFLQHLFNQRLLFPSSLLKLFRKFLYLKGIGWGLLLKLPIDMGLWIKYGLRILLFRYELHKNFLKNFFKGHLLMGLFLLKIVFEYYRRYELSLRRQLSLFGEYRRQKILS